MLSDLLPLATHGVGGAEVAQTLARVAVGSFFAISGFHKLAVPARHAALMATLKKDGVPCVSFNQWWVPTLELGAGSAVLIGLFTPVAAFVLLVVCMVALMVDGLKRIPDWNPINKADWIDCCLYLPEAIYALVLLWLVAAGGGPYSIDTLIFGSKVPVVEVLCDAGSAPCSGLL